MHEGVAPRAAKALSWLNDESTSVSGEIRRRRSLVSSFSSRTPHLYTPSLAWDPRRQSTRAFHTEATTLHPLDCSPYRSTKPPRRLQRRTLFTQHHLSPSHYSSKPHQDYTNDHVEPYPLDRVCPPRRIDGRPRYWRLPLYRYHRLAVLRRVEHRQGCPGRHLS
jgi:hypothetical protein